MTHLDETRRMIQDTAAIIRRGERVGLDFPQIAVDSREPPDVIAQVQAVFKHAFVSDLGDHNGDCHIQLTTGDLIVIERKQVPDDFVASIADGRLFAQCENIPKLCRFPWLVLHGDGFRYGQGGRLLANRDWRGWQEIPWRRESIDGALDRVQLNGMMLKHATDYPEAIKQIIKLCSSADKPHTNRVRTSNPFDATEQAKIDFLASLPGVGTERATNLLQWQPTDWSILGLIHTMLYCDAKALPPKWGKVTRDNIRRFLLNDDEQFFIESGDKHDENQPQ